LLRFILRACFEVFLHLPARTVTFVIAEERAEEEEEEEIYLRRQNHGKVHPELNRMLGSHGNGSCYVIHRSVNEMSKRELGPFSWSNAIGHKSLA
jgi:hypothetical protein